MESRGVEGPLRGAPLRATVLCSLFMVLQGVDTFGISYVAPLLGTAFGIAPSQIGMVFAASVMASLLGAIGIAPLSDRLGRRRVLLASVLLTGAPSLFVPLTRDLGTLVVLRVIVGLGFGAALPVALALVSDLAPGRYRARLVTITTVSVIVGMSLSGLAASFMVPRLGWESLLFSSGSCSLLAVLVGVLLLPESRPIAPGAATQAEPRGAWRTLLQPPALLRAGLFCIVLVVAYIILNFGVFWLPTVILREGFSMEDVGLIGSTRQLLTVALGLAVGVAMDRWGANRVLPLSLALSLGAFLLVSVFAPQARLSLSLLLLGVSVQSAGTSGLLALISASHAAEVRATALGWMQGVSRVAGGSIGAYVGGLLLGSGWTRQMLSEAACIVTAISLVALMAALSVSRRVQRNV